jgi:hypothetical protein
LSSTTAALRNCSGNFADCFRVFHPEAFYRRRGIVRRRPGGSHHEGGATRGWAAPPHGDAGPWPPSGLRSVFDTLPGKITLLELVSSNFENIFYVAFLKHKNSRKQGTGTVASC